MAWSYSDYVTLDYGAARLSQLRLHMQEVADKLSAEMGTSSKNYSTNAIQSYLTSLRKAEREEMALCKAASGDRPAFTRARPRPSP